MKATRMSIMVGILLLALAYVLPLWQIELEAPQYPEPIGLYIYVHTISGIGEHDLENINILNHYIGMKPIEPDSIPELHAMPFILGGLIVLGVATLIFPRRWTIGIWVGAMVISCAVGLYDFDQWERDYGTNLNPNAPIKIEGMIYKPPLIGTEQLLNITAHSYPSWGGYAIVLAIVAGGAALWYSQQGLRQRTTYQSSNQGKRSSIKQLTLVITPLILSGVSGISCSPAPEPIRYGLDECTLCKMIISDQRFGSEIVLTTGKVYKFDSIECMANYLRSKQFDTERIVFVLVTDYTMPGTLIDARKASFLRSEQLPSPMGADLSAYSDSMKASKSLNMYGGKVLSWDDVQRYVASLN
ncbi:MAG: nitrous oxide reductase accessory protein NosL [Chlorobi bacterium]|nr:nitrous oxide reductase accessory protein NosL [Chlorobiota bacterium]